MLRSARPCCLAICLALAFPLPTLAQQQATASYELSLPEQELAASLRALGATALVNIAFNPSVVAGRRAPALPSGHYTLEAALERLLAGSGLVGLRTAGGSYVIELASEKTAAPHAESPAQQEGVREVLSLVEVFGKAKGFSATRADAELKDIPQSVTVITQKTLREQNATDLTTAFNWAPGITTENAGSMFNGVYSRGFEITTVHIDGGAPQRNTGSPMLQNSVDLSEYEAVELLRGADALFGGLGSPGGSINLQRKRPLVRNAASLATSMGSWDTYRLETDLNRVLNDDGSLRGRLVAAEESKHASVDLNKRRMTKLYAITEYDLLPSTVVTLGGTYEHLPDFVWENYGLPRNADGSDPQLPRSAAVNFPWAKSTSTSKGVFFQVDHDINAQWKLKSGVSHSRQDQNGLLSAGAGSAINTITRTISQPTIIENHSSYQQERFDITLTGSFDWNGRKQEVVFGADASRSRIKAGMALVDSWWSGPAINPYAFNPLDYPVPTAAVLSSGFVIAQDQKLREHAVFASVKLRPLEGLSFTVGARDTSSRVVTNAAYFYAGQSLGEGVSETAAHGLISPFLGVVYELNPTYSLYGSAAQTVQVPYGAYRADGHLLKPRGTNLEVGVKAAWDKGRLNGSLALYDIKLKDEVDFHFFTYEPTKPGCCYGESTSISKGAEAELHGRLATGWQMGVGYTFNINRQQNGTKLNTITPKHLLKLWTTYQLPGPFQAWSIGGGVTGQSSNTRRGEVCTAFDARGACIGEYVPFEAIQKAYAVATLRVGYRVNENWNAALNVNNLFDRVYYQTIGNSSSGNWYGAPRNWMLTLRGQF